MKQSLLSLLLFLFTYSLNAQHWEKLTVFEANGKSDFVLDQQNNFVVYGNFTGFTVRINNKPLFSKGKTDIYIALLDSVLGPKQVYTFGGIENEYMVDLVLDDSGYIYLIGDFVDSISFGDWNARSKGKQDIFISKIDPADGRVIWLKTFGSTSDDYAKSITLTEHLYLFYR